MSRLNVRKGKECEDLEARKGEGERKRLMEGDCIVANQERMSSNEQKEGGMESARLRAVKSTRVFEFLRKCCANKREF